MYVQETLQKALLQALKKTTRCAAKNGGNTSSVLPNIQLPYVK
jgi:hypothetical protein